MSVTATKVSVDASDVAGSIRRSLGQLSEAEPVAGVTLDLEGVARLDVAGLQAVIELSQAAASRGAAFTVTGANVAVFKVLRLAGVSNKAAAAGC